ncbi:TPA: hypothetical protein DIC62_01485 [Candidatus Nomurabacteria bacterium]|nr:hypothetical protein [Candidatus Nomurabacteria bacterium]
MDENLKSCAQARTKGEIGMAIDDQEKLLSETEAVISKLIEKIKPIMGGGVDSLPETCSADKPIGAELALRVNKHNEIILDNLKRLGRIIDKIEL